jgi:hypothetical protein
MSAITYDQLESRVGVALGFSYLARYLQQGLGVALLPLLVAVLPIVLKSLVNTFDEKTMERLYQQGHLPIVQKLRTMHEVLLELCRSSEGKWWWRRLPFWSRSVRESTEDLGDIIESFELAGSGDFRRIVERSLSLAHSPERP